VHIQLFIIITDLGLHIISMHLISNFYYLLPLWIMSAAADKQFYRFSGDNRS